MTGVQTCALPISIESLDYTMDSGSSAVLLRDTTAPEFFEKVRAGTVSPSDLNVVEGY